MTTIADIYVTFVTAGIATFANSKDEPREANLLGFPSEPWHTAGAMFYF